MKKLPLLLLTLLLALSPCRLTAQTAETDSIDVLHYDLAIDLSDTTTRLLRGVADITFVLTRNCNSVTFDLICDQVSPVSLDGTVTRGYSYNADDGLLSVYLSGGQVGDTHVLSVPYTSDGYIESSGWGGLHLDPYIYYNLGAAFSAYPHAYGRSWFPCRDNFYDKATYRFTVTSKPGWSAICSGLLQSVDTHPDGTTTHVYLLDHPTPTYIASISSAAWNTIQRQYPSRYGTYPATIGYLSRDSSQVAAAFDILDTVIPYYEHAFGPYRWDRIGYIGTPKGSMEHASNIGLVDACIASTEVDCQMTLCHELGHAWFGNLLTCATDADMWINEGGASFCEELAAEAAYGRSTATQRYVDKLSLVLRNAHHEDQGYRSLSGMSPFYTYGSTTYNKGAIVWHSLRGIMGDSLFYSCMHRLFDRCAFGTIDAASLRDSLSLYSGIDLNGFFDFHVFTPGFVDYDIDQLQVDGYHATITLRQRLVGTDHYAYGNFVPITFFSYDLAREKRWLQFDDSVATLTVDLPFVAAFAVVDYDREISDPCTDNATSLRSSGTKSLGNSYCKIQVPTNTDNPKAWVHVGHHFVHPGGDTLEGIVRLANRYWQVTGFIPWENQYNGMFLYNLGSNNSSNAFNLDLDFYNNPRTLDSICLLYRPDSHHPWQVVSHRRTASSSITTGYFTTRLFTGQYTLAIVDTALVSIPTLPSTSPKNRLNLFPNPSSGNTLRVEVEGYDKNFDLLFFDTNGKNVLQMNNIKSGDSFTHSLTPGSYVAIIQNKFISLQTQIIVQ